VLTSPVGSDAVVMESAVFEGSIVTERLAVFDWVGDDESVTLMVNVEVPADVGVPLIAPVAALRVNPGGSVPIERLQV
jgi:hypothetical protein